MFSEPAFGTSFFGRDEILDILTKRVSALKDGYRQNIALTGQSLCGKSSIILHFLRLIGREGFAPVYVEVVREPFESFARKFIATMFYNALAARGEEAPLDLELLLGRGREAFPRTATAARQVLGAADSGSRDEAYAGLLGLTSVLKEEAGISCIVILDEFDNLEHLGITHPFLAFGRVIMVQKDTMYIVTSSRNRAIRKILSEKLSLLFGNFEIVQVANFAPATAAAFIDRRLSQFEIEPPLKTFLIAFTDGNPFYLDTIIGAARDIALERLTSVIDQRILAAAIVRSVYKATGAIHQYLLNYLLSQLHSETKDRLLAAMTAIARSHTTQPAIARALRIKKTDTGQALATLLEAGLVTRNGVFYELGDPLLGFWLDRVYQRRKELLVDGTIDKDALFAADISSSIDAYAAEAARPVTDRLAGLFNRFSNDLVEIDGKRIRLPHFTKVECRPGRAALPVITGSFNRHVWAAQVFDAAPVAENDIVDYIRTLKDLDQKITQKVIVPLCGIDDNAKLLAKELKISLWESATVNRLTVIYGGRRVVTL